MLIGGEPGGGKSVALQLVVAHGALSPDCRLILVDGKRVELGLWRDCAHRFIGPSMDDAIDTLRWLQDKIDERTEWLLDHKKRKITPDMGLPVYLMAVDEIAYFSATAGTPPRKKSSTPATATSSPAAAPPASSASKPPNARPPTSSPPACGTCSATGGRSAAPPKPAPTPSSATAGPRRATPLRTSTPKPAACPGCALRTASPAASKPPTCPTTTSSPWPSRPPRCAPRQAGAATSSHSVRVTPHDPPRRHAASGVYGKETNTGPADRTYRVPGRRAGACRAAGSGRSTTPSPTRPSRSASSPAGPAMPCAAHPGPGPISRTGCSRPW